MRSRYAAFARKQVDYLLATSHPDLIAAEVRYLMQKEWAVDADDVLWRRSKLGLRFTDTEKVALQRFMVPGPMLKAAE